MEIRDLNLLIDLRRSIKDRLSITMHVSATILVRGLDNLDLNTASKKGYDAVTEIGFKVEIKATQSKSVAFRSHPQHTIIIKTLYDGTFEETYIIKPWLKKIVYLE